MNTVVIVKTLPAIELDCFNPLPPGAAARLADILHDHLKRVEAALDRLRRDGFEMTQSGRRVIARRYSMGASAEIQRYLEDHKEVLPADLCSMETYPW